MQRHCFPAALAMAVFAVAAIPGAARADEFVPFKGKFSGTVTHTPVDAQTDLVDVAATGTATHLGKFAVSAPHLVDLPTRTASGQFEFTAANGDTLTADFTGQATPTATPGVIAIVETAIITGGTGRFAGATGGFVVERLFDRIADTTAGAFQGAIGRARRK